MTETITVRQKSVVKIIHVTEKFRGFWLKVWWDPGVHDSSELGLCPALCSVKQVEVDIGPAPYLSRKCFPSPQMQPESQGRLLLAWIGSRAYPWTNHVWVGWWSVLLGQGWNIHLELQKWDQHFPTTGWEEGRMVAKRKIKVLTRSLSGWGREPKSGPDKQPWGYRACFPIPCTNHCRWCSADNADDHCRWWLQPWN